MKHCSALASLLMILVAACGSVEKADPGDDGVSDDGDPGGGDADGGDPGDADDGDATDGDDSSDGDAADDGEPEPTELCQGTSGERLRQVIRQNDDGTSEQIALRDMETGGDCSFQLDREGTLRCMPRIDGRPFAIGQRYFGDAGCSSAITALFQAPLATPTHVAFPEAGTGCSSGMRYFGLGAELPLGNGSAIYYRDPFGSCVETTSSSSYRYFPVGAELPPSSFMAGTESYDEDGRLRMRRVTGDDGSSVCDPGRLSDTAMDGATCSRERGEDGQMRCLADGYSETQVSNDTGCSSMVDAAQVQASCDRGIDHVRTSVFECNYRYRVRPLGPQIAGPYYQDSSDGCVQASPSTIFFSVEEEAVDPATFAPLAAERVPVGGRLERIDMVGDGIRARLPEWFDTELGVTCSFRLTADGAMRCVPGGTEAPQASVRTYYGDTDCGGGVELATYTEPCDGAPTPTFVVRNPGNGLRVFRLGQPATGALFEDQGGFCGQVSSSAHIFTIGAEVPLNSLVSGSEAPE